MRSAFQNASPSARIVSGRVSSPRKRMKNSIHRRRWKCRAIPKHETGKAARPTSCWPSLTAAAPPPFNLWTHGGAKNGLIMFSYELQRIKLPCKSFKLYINHRGHGTGCAKQATCGSIMRQLGPEIVMESGGKIEAVIIPLAAFWDAFYNPSWMEVARHGGCWLFRHPNLQSSQVVLLSCNGQLIMVGAVNPGWVC